MSDPLVRQEIKWRLNITREIISYLDPMALNPYFDECELFGSDDKEILFMPLKTRREKVRHILNVLESTNRYAMFVNCLDQEVRQGEGFHMGHQYLLAVIKGEEFATTDEIESSERHRRSIVKHRKQLHDIDLKSLVPVMYSHNLVTVNERDVLLDESSFTNRDRIEKFLSITLDTKGPLAHSLLVKCLKESGHTELHGTLTSEIVGSKRKAENLDSCSVPKRMPRRLCIEEPLSGEVYSTFIADIQKCYQSSSWTSLTQTAEKFILNNKDPQLKAVAIIEKGYGFSCRKGMREKAVKCLDRAWSMIEKINGSNACFLKARITHIRATIHRYKGDAKKSLEENEKAFTLLFNCERADDASRIMYGIACARLERLAEDPNPDVVEIEDCFHRSIRYGRKGTPGMCASEARCLIRLAQLSLGTTTDGTCNFEVSPDDVKRAEGYLKQVDVNAISRRCTALFYLIESDFYFSKGNIRDAIESSRKAKEIAIGNRFAVETQFAQSRLTSFQSLDL